MENLVSLKINVSSILIMHLIKIKKYLLKKHQYNIFNDYIGRQRKYSNIHS